MLWEGEIKCITQAFYRQQPKMLVYVQKLMDNPTLSWRVGIGQFLCTACYGRQSRFAIMSVEERQACSKCLSGENRLPFHQRRLEFFRSLLHIFGIYAETHPAMLCANLIFSAAILHKAGSVRGPLSERSASKRRASKKKDIMLDLTSLEEYAFAERRRSGLNWMRNVLQKYM